MKVYVVFKAIPYEGYSRPMQAFSREEDAASFCAKGNRLDYQEVDLPTPELEEMAIALTEAKGWLSGWASAEPYIRKIESALEKAPLA
jgi:hypothetical protein